MDVLERVRTEEIGRQMMERYIGFKMPFTADQEVAYAKYLAASEEQERLYMQVGGTLIMPNERHPLGNLMERMKRFDESRPYQAARGKADKALRAFHQTLRADTRYASHPGLFPESAA